MFKFLTALTLSIGGFCNPNQTDDLSPIHSPHSLPFRIRIEKSDFQLPSNNLNSYGLQSFVHGTHHGKWLLLCGRTNGLHGFGSGIDNFPIREQNTTVFVVDPNNKTVVSRSLHDPSSHLTQAQIDTLSVTAAESFQDKKTLYVVGGYGVDSSTGHFSTKSTLTAIDVPGLMHWVECEDSEEIAAKHIRQTSHPLLQVTGGYLGRTNHHHPFLLIFGQNFKGYYMDDSNGAYTEQVRPFKIIDDGKKLSIKPEKQHTPNHNYRRRDLNVVPIIQKEDKEYKSDFVALSGVFTVDSGIWTVPVLIDSLGESFMPDPAKTHTFKQGMNNYDSAHAGLFSKKTNEMFILLFGGISYLYYENGSFKPDSEIPFINSVTTVKIDSNGNFQQYLMENEYPFIPSDFANFGNPLLFGAEARFIPADYLSTFPNGVFCFDDLGSSPILLGYIVGGIQSSLPNTVDNNDSAASPYIFSVFLERQ